MEVIEDAMHVLCETYSLVSFNKAPTCFKNHVNPSCIDLILTNQPGCFMCIQVIETALSEEIRKYLDKGYISGMLFFA